MILKFYSSEMRILYCPHLIILFFLFFIGCRENNPTEIIHPEYTYIVPPNISDGWNTGSLEDAGMDPSKIIEMINSIKAKDNNKIHSIIIAKDGKLVLEEYFKGLKYNTDIVPNDDDLIEFGRDTLHYFSNGTQSILSVLFGIALSENIQIEINDYVRSYYPEYNSLFQNGKQNITIQHLLSMSSGLDWFEYVFELDAGSDFAIMKNEDDPIKFILQKNLVDDPGSRFSYNSGNTMILYDILKNKLGSDITKYAEQKLFNPLGIQNYKWDRISDSLLDAASGLYLTPRSLAKIGQLYLNGGLWNNEQIVSNNWIIESTKAWINIPIYYFSESYGYNWWKYSFETYSGTFECFFTAGRGEQYIYIFPNINLVITITGGYYYEYADYSIDRLITDFILTSLVL